MTQQPLLLLDVDGPLNPYAASRFRRPDGYRTHDLMPTWWAERQTRRSDGEVKPLRVWLNPAHGAELLALPYELVWATTWMDEANTHIGPNLGLPELPYIRWTELFGEDPDGLHWKTRDVVAWAAGRPFVWVDDELGPQDADWIEANHPGQGLVLHVNPRIGLLAEDFATLREWAAAA
ncbi:HAD domain-containing protein [Kitasatospora sp. NPDC048296]|uniref:HAD domain-containing protein n=1 Tax=Kitasatospora sp. NPDC048296 TaxID=3364048 RepID=UPI0037203AEE